jgi:hypothetical protein
MRSLISSGLSPAYVGAESNMTAKQVVILNSVRTMLSLSIYIQ